MKQNHAGVSTRAYIDGYNLYYGVLKGPRHKWLDPEAFTVRILAGANYEPTPGKQISYCFAPGTTLERTMLFSRKRSI